MRIVCQQMILMKYLALFVFLKKQQNLKLSSAANYRWPFKGLKSSSPEPKGYDTRPLYVALLMLALLVVKKTHKMLDKTRILSLFPNSFNKFNKT